MKFGEFLKEKRQGRGITLRAFAELVGVAPAYMSDIEKAKRNAPTDEILKRMSTVLELTKDEENIFFDLAANSKDTIAQDLRNYISENQNVRVALRAAKDQNLSDKEWIKIIEKIINEKK